MPSLERDVLCVIPCRMGSKGVPKKNLCKVAGKPLLQRAIEFAFALTPNVVVTTESAEAAAWAGNWGVKLCISAQPPRYHGDESKAADVWQYAWLAAEQLTGRKYAFSMYLEPTSPLREHWMAAEAFATLTANLDTVDEVWTLEAVPEKYKAGRQFEVIQGVLYPSSAAFVGLPRQKMPLTYVKNGAIYCAQRDSVLLSAQRSVIWPLITLPLVNIDSLEDLAEADRILSARENLHGEGETG